MKHIDNCLMAIIGTAFGILSTILTGNGILFLVMCFASIGLIMSK